MLNIIILALAGVFGIYRIIKTKDAFANVICVLQVLAIAIILSTLPSLQHIAFYMLLFATFGVLVYSFTRAGDDKKKKIILLSISIPIMLAYAFKALHLSGVSILSFFMIIPLIAYALALKDWKQYKTELGFLSILAAEACIRFLHVFM